MTMPNTRFFTLALFMFLFLTLSGCASIKDSWLGEKAGMASKSGTAPAEPTLLDSVTIQFALESAKLDKSAIAAIDALGKKAAENAPSSLIIKGFTDVTGSEQYNKKLSIQRAVTVKQHLESLALTGVDIKAIGEGEASPVADNSARSGRQKNRRAEISLLKN